MLSYEPHECKVELEHDKFFLSRSFNHIRVKFTMSPNIEIDIGRQDEEGIIGGIELSFTHYSKEASDYDGSPLASPLRRFSNDSIPAL